MSSSSNQKNTKFMVGDNENADFLLYFLENTSVLSEVMSNRISSFVLAITTNFKASEKYGKESMESIVADLKYLNVYKDSFIDMIEQRMKSTFEHEKNRK